VTKKFRRSKVSVSTWSAVHVTSRNRDIILVCKLFLGQIRPPPGKLQQHGVAEFVNECTITENSNGGVIFARPNLLLKLFCFVKCRFYQTFYTTNLPKSWIYICKRRFMAILLICYKVTAGAPVSVRIRGKRTTKDGKFHYSSAILSYDTGLGLNTKATSSRMFIGVSWRVGPCSRWEGWLDLSCAWSWCVRQSCDLLARS